MDVFRFSNPSAPTQMEQGVIVNGLTSKTWVERYAPAGEFTFVAPASSDMKKQLPIGSFVSHVDTAEIMRVENHEISEEEDQEPNLIITGRGYETFLENRIVGSNKVFPTSGAGAEYVIPADEVWNQVVTLIEQHILAVNLVRPSEALPFIEVVNVVAGSGVNEERSLKKGDLYTAVMDLLPVQGLGIKVIRPGPWSPLAVGSPDTAFMIHVGTDRSAEIVFSHDTGDVSSADYLWSDKNKYNTALVQGRWVETLVPTTATGYDLRMMLVDASDIDNQLDVAPVGAALTMIVNKMQQRGRAALAAQLDVALTKVELNKDVGKAVYRKDFDVGDIITVNGDYNESSAMQITEYVEIEDETGTVGFPTLELL